MSNLKRYAAPLVFAVVLAGIVLMMAAGKFFEHILKLEE